MIKHLKYFKSQRKVQVDDSASQTHNKFLLKPIFRIIKIWEHLLSTNKHALTERPQKLIKRGGKKPGLLYPKIFLHFNSWPSISTMVRIIQIIICNRSSYFIKPTCGSQNIVHYMTLNWVIVHHNQNHRNILFNNKYLHILLNCCDYSYLIRVDILTTSNIHVEETPASHMSP